MVLRILSEREVFLEVESDVVGQSDRRPAQRLLKS
jgi:hypothetical protein